MEALLASNFNRLLRPTPLSCPFRPPLRSKPLILPLLRSTSRPKCRPRSSPSANPPCFNGWEDVIVSADGSRSEPIRHLLVSLGIRNRKDAILICIGFACALAISKVRFSLVAMVPVSILAFLAGLSIGDRPRRDGGDGNGGKDGNLAGLFELFDSKVEELKGVVESGDAGRFAEAAEAVRAAVKEAAAECVNWSEMERMVGQRAGSRRKDTGLGRFDFTRFLASLGEVLVSSKPAKSREGSIREAALEQLNSSEKNGRSSELKENASSSIPSREVDKTDVVIPSFQMHTGAESPSDNVLTEGSRRSRGITEKDANVEDMSEVLSSKSNRVQDEHQSPRYSHGKFDTGRLPFEEERANTNRMLRFTNRKSSFEEVVLEENSYRKKDMQDFSVGGDFSKAKGSAEWSFSESASALHSEMEMRDKIHMRSNDRQGIDDFNEEKNHVKGILFDDHLDTPNLKSYDAPSASPVPSHEEFNQNVKEAVCLLKQAKECLKNENEEEAAETSLYKSANLLSTAVSLNPQSLLAVGQLGNTYLLHGELKLKISRDLRTLLSRSDLGPIRKGCKMQLKGLSKQSVSKEKVASVLIDICEECEELLVKAGKTYKMALSIDEDDIRALYNWGLALTLRAQLIGDIGPEAAFDADKVYLAAIDKFSALTSRSHACSPEALFRWGLVLQQRSQLRSPDSREKIKLLKQAKSMFEDVLRSDTDRPVVREALFSCISELNFYRQLK